MTKPIALTVFRGSILVLFLLCSINLYAGSNAICQEDTTKADINRIDSLVIEEINVKGQLSKSNLLSGSKGKILNLNEIKSIPNLLGDSDPFLIVKSLGGITQPVDGNSGIYVRGGNYDQNLILLNGTLIQSTSHVFGLFSVFNPDLIENIRFIKSGIPAEYGGRLSSVFEVNTTNSPVEHSKANGSIGIVASRLAFQTPINQQLSLYGSVRGSYLNSIVLPLVNLFLSDKTFTSNKYGYVDTNWGLIYSLSPKTKISTHYYYGNDNIKWDLSTNASQWNNRTASIHLNHVFNKSWSMNHHLGYSEFNIGSDLAWGNSTFLLSSGTRNLTYKTDFFSIHKNHQIKFGTELGYYVSNPFVATTDTLIAIELNNEHNTFHTVQSSAYIRDEYSSGRFLINVGLRGNAYQQLGPYTDYTQSSSGEFYKNGVVKSYYNLEPRFFIRYLINKESSVKSSVSRHVQFLNQIPMLSVGIPYDLQIPASLYVKPQTSWHFSSGYYRNFDFNAYETSIEVYYKNFDNQLEFTSGLGGTFTNKMLEKSLLYGRGYAYGLEVSMHKTRGKFVGWCTYNLAWNIRQFDNLNHGEPFFACNDRRHNLSLVGIYQLNSKWSLSSMFILASGSRINIPTSWFIIDRKVVFEYEGYNAFKMPPYHRLDISANYKLNQSKKFRSDLTFSVYNTYNRANPYRIYTITKESISGIDIPNIHLGMSYLLPIVPSISWSFHFN